MRQVGSLSNQEEATRFAAFLITEGVAAHSENNDQSWIIWVHDENQVAEAKRAFEEFEQSPDSSKYLGVERKADEIIREKEKERERASKNVIPMRGQWNRGRARRRPLVIAMIVISIVVYLASDRGRDVQGSVARSLLFLDRAHLETGTWNPYSTSDRLIDIRKGEVWRFVTPIFFHYGTMHVVFNMFMFYQLGSPVEERRGTSRMLWIVLVTAVLSNAVQSLVPVSWGGSPFAAGMSGVLYGVFGYSWMKSKYQPELGILIPQSTVTILIGWLLLGMTGVLENIGVNIANWAHGIGFAVGVVIGYAPVWPRSIRGS